MTSYNHRTLKSLCHCQISITNMDLSPEYRLYYSTPTCHFHLDICTRNLAHPKPKPKSCSFPQTSPYCGNVTYDSSVFYLPPSPSNPVIKSSQLSFKILLRIWPPPPLLLACSWPPITLTWIAQMPSDQCPSSTFSLFNLFPHIQHGTEKT